MTGRSVKTEEEIEILRKGGKILARILTRVQQHVAPGVTTEELDRHAELLIREAGGNPAFKGYRAFDAKVPYPASLCVSVNDEVVHGIPRRSRVLQEGDIVGLDIGMWWPTHESRIMSHESQGGRDSSFKFPAEGEARHGRQVPRPMVTDMAVTVGVGTISPEAAKLLQVTEESLYKGIERIKAGARIGDIGAEIQAHIERHGFGVVRELAGHGVGYQLHEDPYVPNYGSRGEGSVLHAGMVIAIEPMATEGKFAVVLDKDEWTFRTADGRLAAHFEHTVVVTEDGGLIVTKE
ncbi:MAG: type I methionyl aminopeptidase [Candidatus Sungbacteria bacterium]|nr:type I methionyl aminopeptidase [Candidatus Sungbacteria bacterium]